MNWSELRRQKKLSYGESECSHFFLNYYKGVQRNRAVSGKYPASGRKMVKGAYIFLGLKILQCIYILMRMIQYRENK